MEDKRAPLANGATLVVGSIVALLVAWWALAAGFRELRAEDDTTDDTALTQFIERGAAPAPDIEWRERIARNPTDAGPYGKLAGVLEEQGRRDEARAAYEQALRFDPTSPQAMRAAAGFYLRMGDAGRALPLLAHSIELYSSSGSEIWPIFAAELESGRGGDYLVRAARENPRWWTRFFREVCDDAANEAELLRIFDARVEAGLVTRGERECLIGRMQRAKRWADAYEVWRKSLPRAQRDEVTPVFNSGFEWPVSSVGFDWITPNQDAASVESEATGGMQGKRALHVTFVNRLYKGPPIYHYLMLQPGRYRLEGMRRADGFESWLGLQWAVYCHADDESSLRQLAKTDPFTGSGGWGEFRRDFTVPAGCPVQVLRLELANPKRDADTPGAVPARLRGSLWFDDVEITPLG